MTTFTVLISHYSASLAQCFQLLMLGSETFPQCIGFRQECQITCSLGGICKFIRQCHQCSNISVQLLFLGFLLLAVVCVELGVVGCLFLLLFQVCKIALPCPLYI